MYIPGYTIELFHHSYRGLVLTHLFPMRPFSTRWKQKTVRFSDVFREQRKGALGTNGLRIGLVGGYCLAYFQGPQECLQSPKPILVKCYFSLPKIHRKTPVPDSLL